MSSFGAYDIRTKEWGIDYLVSSSNKCLQGIPGFAFVIANLKHFKNCQNNSRVLTLDLYDQWKGLESNGQFRFTPPTHVIKSFSVALEEFNSEGGVSARFNRYSTNQKLNNKKLLTMNRLLVQKMEEMGFKLYIDKNLQGCIITTFIQPSHKDFNFEELYDYLAKKNLVIYPGKLTKAETFRISTIGEINSEDVLNLMNEIRAYLNAKNIPIPVK